MHFLNGLDYFRGSLESRNAIKIKDFFMFCDTSASVSSQYDSAPALAGLRSEPACRSRRELSTDEKALAVFLAVIVGCLTFGIGGVLLYWALTDSWTSRRVVLLDPPYRHRYPSPVVVSTPPSFLIPDTSLSYRPALLMPDTSWSHLSHRPATCLYAGRERVSLGGSSALTPHFGDHVRVGERCALQNFGRLGR